MKKLLVIIVLGLLWFNVSYAETLGVDKNVDHYLSKEGYSLHSTDLIKSGQYVYHLIKGGSPGPDIITCVYVVEDGVTVCFTP